MLTGMLVLIALFILCAAVAIVKVAKAFDAEFEDKE
jgi:hypothetical protein